jgi:hypothetical protein
MAQSDNPTDDTDTTQENRPYDDTDVGLTWKAERKGDRYIAPDEVRRRVRELDGDLYCRLDSSHDEPEFHLVTGQPTVLIFVVNDDKPTVLTQTGVHWDHPKSRNFVYVGGTGITRRDGWVENLLGGGE